MFKNVSYRETAYLQKRSFFFCGKAQSYSVSFCLLSYIYITPGRDHKLCDKFVSAYLSTDFSCLFLIPEIWKNQNLIIIIENKSFEIQWSAKQFSKNIHLLVFGQRHANFQEIRRSQWVDIINEGAQSFTYTNAFSWNISFIFVIWFFSKMLKNSSDAFTNSFH